MDPHALDARHPLLAAALAEHGMAAADMEALMKAARERDIHMPGAAEIVYQPHIVCIHRNDAQGRRFVQISLGGRTWAGHCVSRVTVIGVNLPEAVADALQGHPLTSALNIPGATEVLIDHIVNDRGRMHIHLEPCSREPTP